VRSFLETAHEGDPALEEQAPVQERDLFRLLREKVANLFVTGLLKELKEANEILGAEHTAEEICAKSDDDWELIAGSSDASRGADPENQEKKKTVSGLFAKWAPTPGGMHDNALGLSATIRQKLIQRLEAKNSLPLLDALDAACGTGSRTAETAAELNLHKHVLTPLRFGVSLTVDLESIQPRNACCALGMPTISPFQGTIFAFERHGTT
jgi:hypothetical protein